MDWKDKLDRIKKRLEQERDELLLKGHLAKMEARDEVEALEGKWQTFKAKIAEIEISGVKEGAWETADKLADELREGYDNIRDRMKKMREERKSGPRTG